MTSTISYSMVSDAKPSGKDGRFSRKGAEAQQPEKHAGFAALRLCGNALDPTCL